MPDAPKAPESADKRRKDSEESISMVQFFGKYRDVTLVVLALTLMYFCHFLIQTYLAKIIGTFETQGIEAIQGRALFIQAMVELPTMFGFARIMKRLGIPKILCIASVVYSLKHVLIAFCGSVPMLYAAMVLQMFSYAILVPGSVYYANQSVAEEDRNKGQAIFGATVTVGGLLASLIGGQLLNITNISIVLLIGVIASLCGTALIFFALGPKDLFKKKPQAAPVEAAAPVEVTPEASSPAPAEITLEMPEETPAEPAAPVTEDTEQ
jgi:PPP family 3-phenylpropionic acid transporter